MAGKGTLITLFTDHMIRTDMRQDSIAVSSILEAFVARIHVEVANVRWLYLLADISRAYKNNLFTVIAPIICTSQAVNRRGVLHSQTQRWKGLVDAHFSISMKQVNLLVN